MSITPTPSASSVVVASSRLRSTHSGSTGSAARRSTSTNATSSSAPPANTATLVGELHAHAWPPSSTPSRSSVMPLVSSDGAEVVDAVLAALHRLVEVPRDEHRRRAGTAAR